MKVKRIFGTLRSRIFAALFAISLVPIAVLGVQGYHCAMQAVTELAHKHLLAVANARSTAVINWIAERTRSIETLASLPTTASLLSRKAAKKANLQDTLQQSLDSFRLANQSFDQVTVLDADRDPIAQSGSAEGVPHSLTDTELLSAAELAEDAVYGVVHGNAAGGVGLHVACSVKEANGNTVGFVVAYLDLAKSLTPILQDRQGLYETGKVYLVSADEEILTEPLSGDTVAFSKWGASPAQASHTHRTRSGVITYVDYKRNVVLGADIPIEFEGWHLIAEIDRDEALVWLRVLLIRSLATGLVTCVVVVAIAFWISHLVGKPLRQLMRVSHRIRAGHVEERLEPMDVAEAEEVRKAFNAMLDELREKQDELVRATTLAYVGELTSSTVHEMRNPLSSIKLNVQALAKVVKDEPRNREVSEIALTQVDRLERMFTDLLQFGRPVDLDVQPVIFSDMIEDMFDLIEFWAKQKKVRFETIDDLDGKLLHVDREQFCRALTNLVLNAIEASPESGLVKIHACSGGSTGETIEISVTDSGPGLSAKGLECAFQPFFTTKPEGTGLGLSNVKKIVDLHGGEITVENREEGGAAFRIRLSAGPSP